MKTIQQNQILTSRSICDYNCIFSLTVLERKGNFAKINYNGSVMRIKVRKDTEGNEFLIPATYSMAPIFRAL